MTLGKRIYWVLALVVVMALAGAAVTMASSMTSAGGSGETLANQTCDCDQQDEADDAIENAAKGPDTDDIEEECECGSQDEADDAIESAAKGPDTDNIEEQSGDQNEADDSAEQQQSGVLDDGKDLLPQAQITLDQAIAAAQSAASGPVGEVDLERSHGRLVFNVDIGDKDVKVDAGDGSIVGVDSDD
jgi:uncharacterized membrane protein YkoI